jgi:hypothetical protein
MRIEIEGVGVVEVEDSFLQMDPAAQEAFITGIVRSVNEGRRGSEVEQSEDPRQRTRAAAQGLTLGFGDEIEAALRAPFSDQTYSEIRDDVRGKIEDYREADPLGAVGFEVGGAVIPGLLGLLTGGSGTAATGAATTARLAPTMARAAKVGAGTGAAYGYGSGEGGVTERVINAGKDAVIGTVAGPVGTLAGRGIGKGVNYGVDKLSRSYGNAGTAVNSQIQKIAHESGLTVDEIIERVGRGEILAEMTPTTRSATRSIRSMGGAPAEAITTPLRNRAAAGRQEAVGALQRELTDDIDGNVYAAIQQSDEAARLAEKAAYDAAFKGAPEVPEEVVYALADILERDPKLADRAAKLLKVKTKQAPFFEVEDGQVIFTRAPTLEEAELVRRSVNNATTKAFNKGDGALGEVYGDLEGGLRGSLDKAAKPLQAARAQASTTRKARDAFKEGQIALNQGPDHVAVKWQELQSAAPEAQKAYRAGIMDAIRKRSSTSGGVTMVNNIATPDKAEAMILREILTPEQFERAVGGMLDTPGTVLGPVGRGAQSQIAYKEIVGGSQTAETLKNSDRLGSIGIVSRFMALFSGNISAGAGLVADLGGEIAKKLTDKQRLQVAQIMMQSDKQALVKLLQDKDGMVKLKRFIEGAAARVHTAHVGSVAANTLLEGSRPY